MHWQPNHPAFQHLLRAVLEQSATIYAVGGVVRDHLLARSGKMTDLDLMVDQPALPLALAVADKLGWAFYPLDEMRDVARLVFTANAGMPLICDIARVRGGSIEGDLLMRDFTINAMAFAIDRPGQATLIDCCGGQADLKRQVVRRVSAASMADDPLRLLRAIRFVVQLGFELDEATRLQIKQICSTITLTSAERVRDELWKILATDQPALGIQAMASVGLLAHVLPEVAQMAGVAQSYPHTEDVLNHTLRVMQNAVALRNWILGREAERPADVNLAATQPKLGSKAERNPVAGAMATWIAALAPYLIPLRRHMREPLADGRNRAEWLVWHAMLHDIGKPPARTEEQQLDHSMRYRFFNHERLSAEMVEERLTTLRFSKQEVALARRVADFHMRPHLLNASFPGQPLSRRAQFRFLRDTLPGQLNNKMGMSAVRVSDGVDVLCLAIADHQAIHRQVITEESSYLQHMKELLDYAFATDGFQQVGQQSLVDGHMLMQTFALPPGRQVGQLLARLQEAQAAGEIDSIEAALTLAGSWLQESASAQSKLT